jgi:hypothetical protein
MEMGRPGSLFVLIYSPGDGIVCQASCILLIKKNINT